MSKHGKIVTTHVANKMNETKREKKKIWKTTKANEEANKNYSSNSISSRNNCFICCRPVASLTIFVLIEILRWNRLNEVKLQHSYSDGGH